MIMIPGHRCRTLELPGQLAIFSRRHTRLTAEKSAQSSMVMQANAGRDAPGRFTGSGVFRGTPVAYAGTWSASAFYRLTYSVDTTSGAIQSISLEGSTADYSSPLGNSLFTDAATAYAGMYQSGEAGSIYAVVDNFAVAVPEPGSTAILVVGFLGLAIYRRLGTSASRA